VPLDGKELLEGYANCRLLLRLHAIFTALMYWAHRADILAIAWFSWYDYEL